MHADASWGTDPPEEHVRVLRGVLGAYDELGDTVGQGWARSHAVIPQLQLGRNDEAREAFERALALTRQEPERRFLERRIAELPV